MKKLIAILIAAFALTAFAADKKPLPPTTQDVRPPVPNVSPEDKAKNKMLLAKKKKDKKGKKDNTKSPSKKSK
jgi:hypothetical protein